MSYKINVPSVFSINGVGSDIDITSTDNSVEINKTGSVYDLSVRNADIDITSSEDTIDISKNNGTYDINNEWMKMFDVRRADSMVFEGAANGGRGWTARRIENNTTGEPNDTVYTVLYDRIGSGGANRRFMNYHRLNLYHSDFCMVGADFSDMFNGCRNLFSVSFNYASNFGSALRMFYGCMRLENVDTERWNTIACQTYQYMFGGCERLHHLNLRGWNTFNGEDFSYMFAGCSRLTTLDISGWIIHKFGLHSNLHRPFYDDSIYDNMFTGCDDLKTIIMFGCDDYTIQCISSVKPIGTTIVTSSGFIN